MIAQLVEFKSHIVDSTSSIGHLSAVSSRYLYISIHYICVYVCVCIYIYQALLCLVSQLVIVSFLVNMNFYWSSLLSSLYKVKSLILCILVADQRF